MPCSCCGWRGAAARGSSGGAVRTYSGSADGSLLVSAAPQLPQKRVCSAFSLPQLGHNTSGLLNARNLPCGVGCGPNCCGMRAGQQPLTFTLLQAAC